ncbi:hypothetical protein [Streptomyces sp. NBC_01244]|nr:hypothetical protein OG247_03785 [Streptomyces sp. NBC_01244]
MPAATPAQQLRRTRRRGRDGPAQPYGALLAAEELIAVNRLKPGMPARRG